ETGKSLLPTAVVILEERDPEGCLRALLKLQRLNLGVGSNTLFSRWATYDAGAATRALQRLPSVRDRKYARAAIEGGLERQAEGTRGSSATRDKSSEGKEDFSPVMEAARVLEESTGQNFAPLESLP